MNILFTVFMAYLAYTGLIRPAIKLYKESHKKES